VEENDSAASGSSRQKKPCPVNRDSSTARNDSPWLISWKATSSSPLVLGWSSM
jgi:hypothetical protein